MGEEQVAVVCGSLAPVHTVPVATMDTVTVVETEPQVQQDSLLVDLGCPQVTTEEEEEDEEEDASIRVMEATTRDGTEEEWLNSTLMIVKPAEQQLPYTVNPQPSCTPLLVHKPMSCSQLTLPMPISTSNSLMVGTTGYLDKSETNSLLLPMCRICHMPDEIGSPDLLISPCRCSGTLQFIHHSCLMRWLEISAKKSRRPPKCELCHYQYHRHKKFKLHHWRMPRISRQDKILHIVFVVNLVIMIACAVATVMCFLSDKGQVTKFPREKVDLTTEEIVTLSCGVLFFVSFFVAMSVQIKAKHTIYQLLIKFVMQNMEWEIDEYDKSKDSLYFKSTPEYV